MKRVLVVRHAKSDWTDPSLHDHDRPLDARGARDAPRMGRLLRDEKLVPDLIVSSTATRAHETAVELAEASGYRGRLSLARDLYGGGPREYLARIATTPDDVDLLMVVGHNPTVEELVALLTGVKARMPTATIAVVESDGASWRELLPATARLVALWTPKQLGTPD
jgi:phosphohistidine phosphatase